MCSEVLGAHGRRGPPLPAGAPTPGVGEAGERGVLGAGGPGERAGLHAHRARDAKKSRGCEQLPPPKMGDMGEGRGGEEV